jgi:15-cis-phytoene synthase
MSYAVAYSAPLPPAPAASRAEEDRYLWDAFRFHSRTFSLASRLLRREVHLPVATLYMFCRTIDGVADERVLEVGVPRALAELDTARMALVRTLEGRPPEGLLWRRLAEVNEQFDLAPEPLFELLEGAEWDLTGTPITSEADLLAYSELVAGSVGAMMLPFLVANRTQIPVLTPSARALGGAMQITNILRDVGEDIQRLGRVYLPQSLLEAFGVTPQTLSQLHRGGAPGIAYTRMTESLMELAERLYRQAQPGIAALPLRSRLGISAAARMYREILNEVRAAGYDNLARRNAVDLSRKLLLVAHDDYGRRRARLRDQLAVQGA